MKDHEIAQLVDDLRDIAIQHHGHEYLRELIARRVVPPIQTQVEARRQAQEGQYAEREQLSRQIKQAQRKAVVPVLAEDHQGMRVDYRGLLGQVRRELERTAGGHAEMLRQLQGHMTELGIRYYGGDLSAVDEFLQLYCVEREARAAAQLKQQGEAHAA